MAEWSKRQRRPAAWLVDDTGGGQGVRQGGTRSQVPRGSDSSAPTGISGIPGCSMQTKDELNALPSSAVATALFVESNRFSGRALVAVKGDAKLLFFTSPPIVCLGFFLCLCDLRVFVKD